jgi:hypothetical protein
VPDAVAIVLLGVLAAYAVLFFGLTVYQVVRMARHGVDALGAAFAWACVIAGIVPFAAAALMWEVAS